MRRLDGMSRGWRTGVTALLAALLAAGCAGGSGPRAGSDDPAGTAVAADDAASARAARCTALLESVDARVAAAGVADGGARRVDGFPHLRVNRFLAAVRPAGPGPAWDAWVERMRALDAAARRAELANLGVPDAQRERVEACAAALAAQDMDAGARRALAAAAEVPDDYATWQRVVGLYPVASIGLLTGVDLLRRDLARDFATPMESQPVRGRLVRFVPPDAAPAAPAPPARDALGVPAPDDDALDALFRAHAPVFEVDVVRPDDRIGEPGLDARGRARVDPARPVVYRYVDHALFDGEVVLQLVYVAWFRSRPLTGALDILGGALDGLVWRVTLDGDGRALAYDSIHPCGCYHLVFPGERLTPRPPPARYEEPLLSPRAAPPGPGRMRLRVAERTHFISQLARDDAAAQAAAGGVAYRFADYDALRSLPVPGGGRASLFRPDGLVTGSERRERFILWMAGIESPGAMRQAGRHAIAFVGRRHFDDPRLLARYFRRTAP